jgi:hypothetical protein
MNDAIPQDSTPEKTSRAWERPFLEALRLTGNVSKACRVVGIDRTTPYKAREADPDLAAAWDDAIADACDELEAEARRRAMGYQKPIYWRGQIVGNSLEYSDTLLMFLLKAHRPDKFREHKQVALEALLAQLPPAFAQEVRRALGDQQ